MQWFFTSLICTALLLSPTMAGLHLCCVIDASSEQEFASVSCGETRHCANGPAVPEPFDQPDPSDSDCDHQMVCCTTPTLLSPPNGPTVSVVPEVRWYTRAAYTMPLGVGHFDRLKRPPRTHATS